MGDETGPLRVVVGIDGSEASNRAAERAAAVFPDAEFTLVAVIDAIEDPEADAGGFEGPVMTEQEAQDEYRERRVGAVGALAAAARIFDGRPVHEEVVEGDGHVGSHLCDKADELGAAVLVVGSHGHAAITDVLIGSVGLYVVHHANQPVLVVRH
jgi:nucleotide-binding universal stress UspA family protein